MQNIRKFEHLRLARLINKFRLSTDPTEIYNSAIDNYDALIEISWNQKNAVKLALMAEMPVSKVNESVEAILDSLFFNKNNDPYISLGLRGNEDKSVVTKRWRQLITIYHPDKYPGNRAYEERAKRINEAYEEIRRSENNIKKENFSAGSNKISKRANPQRTFVNHLRKGKTSRRKIYLPGFLRHIPIIVAISMVLISFIFIFLVIKMF